MKWPSLVSFRDLMGTKLATEQPITGEPAEEEIQATAPNYLLPTSASALPEGARGCLMEVMAPHQQQRSRDNIFTCDGPRLGFYSMFLNCWVSRPWKGSLSTITTVPTECWREAHSGAGAGKARRAWGRGRSGREMVSGLHSLPNGKGSVGANI